MQKAFEGEEEIIGSDILDIEISKIASCEKRDKVEGVYRALTSNIIEISEGIEDRAKEIIEIIEISNIKAFDSLHLASAEAGADILLTTDMKFLRNCKKIFCKVDVKNPIEYVMEVFDYDNTDD